MSDEFHGKINLLVRSYYRNSLGNSLRNVKRIRRDDISSEFHNES